MLHYFSHDSIKWFLNLLAKHVKKLVSILVTLLSIYYGIITFFFLFFSICIYGLIWIMPRENDIFKSFKNDSNFVSYINKLKNYCYKLLEHIFFFWECLLSLLHLNIINFLFNYKLTYFHSIA